MPRTPLLSRHDVPAALGLLTRLPIPVDGSAATTRGAAAAWAFPLAGALLAGIAGTVHTLATLAGLPHVIGVVFTVIALIMLTGALHEDGLADTVDGFWGGWTQERRLEIMKDSHIGSYGVLALVLSVGLRISALDALPILEFGWALVAASALSRGGMALLWWALPSARRNGLSARSGRPGVATACLSFGVATVISFAVLPPSGAGAAVLAALVAVIVVGLLARQKIGGQTGDVLGACQQVAEISILMTLVAISA